MQAKKPMVRRGRPSKKQAEMRRQALLASAFEEFLERGFAETTIDALAEKLNMTKRTIYSLYPTKKELFRASIEHAISKTRISDEKYQQAATDDIVSTLRNVAMLRINMYLQSDGLALQRILSAESNRFPELVALNYRHDPKAARAFVMAQLERFKAAGVIDFSDAFMTAELFLGMSVGRTINGMAAGELPNDPVAIQTWVDGAIQVFLYGVANS